MPGPYQSMFYSWNMGPIHFIGIDTEVYFEPLVTRNASVLQHYEWLRNDLEVIDS